MSFGVPWEHVGRGPRVRVVLLDLKGYLRHSWEGTLEGSDDNMIILQVVAKRELKFDELTIDVGDQVVQHFPRNEWFYIQEYLTPSGGVKGWYCNIATPLQSNSRASRRET